MLDQASNTAHLANLPQIYLPVREASNDGLSVQDVHTANYSIHSNTFFQDSLLPWFEPFRRSWPVVHKWPAHEGKGHCDKSLNYKYPSPPAPSI
jgi:hypothetical protein